jgi:hypothetical protein
MPWLMTPDKMSVFLTEQLSDDEEIAWCVASDENVMERGEGLFSGDPSVQPSVRVTDHDRSLLPNLPPRQWRPFFPLLHCSISSHHGYTVTTLCLVEDSEIAI